MSQDVARQDSGQQDSGQRDPGQRDSGQQALGQQALGKEVSPQAADRIGADAAGGPGQDLAQASKEPQGQAASPASGAKHAAAMEPQGDSGSGHPVKTSIAAMAVGSVGVVYGDIGTSPLYALRESLAHSKSAGLDDGAVIGTVSLLVWALFFTVTAKYVLFLMRADNKGEGGTLFTHGARQ